MKLYKLYYTHFVNYSLPRNLNNNYSLGFILGILFFFQILSGLLLVMFYIPHETLAYKTISFIMKDIRGG